jgi:hypothetical protein
MLDVNLPSPLVLALIGGLLAVLVAALVRWRLGRRRYRRRRKVTYYTG